MFIKEIKSRYGNDIFGTLACEFCEKECKMSNGYDDDFYHNKVIPSMKYPSCGKDRIEILKGENT